MKNAILICISCFHDFFEGLHESELNGHLCAHSDQGEEHAFVQCHDSFLSNRFFEGMHVTLIVLFGFGDDFDFDVFEGKHADDLPPSCHYSTS